VWIVKKKTKSWEDDVFPSLLPKTMMKDDGEKCFFFNDEILVDKRDDDDIDGSDGF